MAGREINIPFGPDKTGGLGILPPIDEEEAGQDAAAADSDPFAEPSPEKYRNAASESADGLPVRSRRSQRKLPDIPAIAAQPRQGDPAATAAAAGAEAAGVEDPDLDVFDDDQDGQDGDDEQDADYYAGGMTDEEATAQGYDDMQMSFLALRDSMGQGRELKAREREIDEFAAQLEDDKSELADREDILANYASIVAEQDGIAERGIQRRDACKAQLAQVSANLQETTEALESMRDYHTTEMEPLETQLGRARANADQAKNDERSRKSELNAAESEMRRAASHDDTTMATARLEQVRRSYEEARSRSERAKDTLAEVQRIYDDARQQIEQSEGPLERSIEDLKKQESDLRAEITRLGEEISAARKRRQFCDAVYQYPDETAKLRASVQADERTLDEMNEEFEELEGQLAQSKQQARKAKLALGILAAIVIIFLIALIIVLVRG